MCGYGTLGLEIMNQVPNVDAIILPVEKGPLFAGVCVAVKSMFPAVQIVVSLTCLYQVKWTCGSIGIRGFYALQKRSI